MGEQGISITIVVGEWIPDQANALEQAGVVAEALACTARFTKVLAEKTSGAMGEI